MTVVFVPLLFKCCGKAQTNCIWSPKWW